jgi:hypothetical protein
LEEITSGKKDTPPAKGSFTITKKGRITFVEHHDREGGVQIIGASGYKPLAS